MSIKEENTTSVKKNDSERNKIIKENMQIDAEDKQANLHNSNLNGSRNKGIIFLYSLTIEKIARSIAEVQQNVTNTADVLIFLEILGYDDKTAEKLGYSNLVHLAQTVYPYIHFYSEAEKTLLSINIKNEEEVNKIDQDGRYARLASKILDKASQARLLSPTQTRGSGSSSNNTQIRETAGIPSAKKRIFEGLVMALPWLGTLLMLYTTGVSLWMSGILSTRMTTYFLGGVLLGLIASEGISQISIRQFSFYYYQQNFGEIKRIIARHYAISGIVCAFLALIISFTFLGYTNIITGLHFELNNTFGEYGKDTALTVTIFAMVSTIMHRSSFMIIYAMRKILYAALAYGCGLAVLILSFYIFAPLITNNIISKYFISLAIALITLTIFAVIKHITLVRQNDDRKRPANTMKSNQDLPRFYSPPSFSKNTLKSNFSIQWWEGSFYFIYGIAFFLILFEDRLLSWIHFSNGVVTIMFNSTYHLGADMAFALLLVTGVLQYIQLSPLYTEINNISSRTEITRISNISKFLFARYKNVLIWSLLASGIIITILYLIGPSIIERIGYTQQTAYYTSAENNIHDELIRESITIMKIMLASYLLLSIFTINSIFIMLLNKMKHLIIILIVAVTIDTIIGLIMQDIATFASAALGSLIANIVLAFISTLYLLKILRNNDIISFFSRFS